MPVHFLRRWFRRPSREEEIAAGNRDRRIPPVVRELTRPPAKSRDFRVLSKWQ